MVLHTSLHQEWDFVQLFTQGLGEDFVPANKYLCRADTNMLYQAINSLLVKQTELALMNPT